MALKVFPQLLSGAIAQFPLERTFKTRQLRPDSPSTRRNPIPDFAYQRLSWLLRYEELSQAEANQLRDFFHTCRGRLDSFLFLDPCSNLLADSENLQALNWHRGGLAQISPIESGGGQFTLHQVRNSSPITQGAYQTLSIPASLSYVLSLHACSTSIAQLTLFGRTSSVSILNTFPVGPEETRYWLTISLGSPEDQMDFGFEVEAGKTVLVSHIQLEAQPFPSSYKPNHGYGGIYPHAHFANDSLLLVATGNNQYSSELIIESPQRS